MAGRLDLSRVLRDLRRPKSARTSPQGGGLTRKARGCGPVAPGGGAWGPVAGAGAGISRLGRKGNCGVIPRRWPTCAGAACGMIPTRFAGLGVLAGDMGKGTKTGP